LRLLDRYDVDLVVLARFMKILPPGVCWRYRNRIINVHPSLLPAFPGAQAYRQAWEKGVRVVGATAHFVTPDLDQGPIIAQRAFEVSPGEGVERIHARGRAVESRVLLEAIDLYLRKRLDVHWGRVWTE
ncbi:MAG: formyltransferase family protein, partial [Candidatus Rokuibacteriota bacterium]